MAQEGMRVGSSSCKSEKGRGTGDGMSGIEGEGKVAIVDKEICIACSMCAQTCPEKAIAIAHIALVDSQKCVGCGLCVEECPTEAISLTG